MKHTNVDVEPFGENVKKKYKHHADREDDIIKQWGSMFRAEMAECFWLILLWSSETWVELQTFTLWDRFHILTSDLWPHTGRVSMLHTAVVYGNVMEHTNPILAWNRWGDQNARHFCQCPFKNKRVTSPDWTLSCLYCSCSLLRESLQAHADAW